MEMPSLSGLDGLTELGSRSRVDMRPTLLRVLTDLYVQKLTHTADEERHYTELALRLLESVDVPTRAAVATRLARHLSPPPRVMQQLSGDLPEVVKALRSHVASRPASDVSSAPPKIAEPVERLPLAPVNGAARKQADREPACESRTHEGAEEFIGASVAAELNELFFAATADERRLILLNLNIVAAPPNRGAGIVHDATIGPRLETALLARKREDFAQQLARSLRISREQARLIASDELGEPIVVAAKALGIAREVLYRILLFINTAVGHSVERVHALAELHDAISAEAVEHLVAIWQAVDASTVARPGPAGSHQPLLANERASVRPAASIQGAPAAVRRIERRDAS